MSYSVTGHILISGNPPKYNADLVNSVVASEGKQLGIYCSEYDPRWKTTDYWRRVDEKSIEEMIKKTWS